jgi:hypothetical protein
MSLEPVEGGAFKFQDVRQTHEVGAIMVRFRSDKFT